MATTYKTPQSKYWFARYTDSTGKRVSRSTKTESRREAKRITALPATSISGSFGRIMDAAGIPHKVETSPGVVGLKSFHSLRHSFASALADADVHSDVRMRLTGHASGSVHANYTHHEESLQRAVGQLPVL